MGEALINKVRVLPTAGTTADSNNNSQIVQSVTHMDIFMDTWTEDGPDHFGHLCKLVYKNAFQSGCCTGHRTWWYYLMYYGRLLGATRED